MSKQTTLPTLPTFTIIRTMVVVAFLVATGGSYYLFTHNKIKIPDVTFLSLNGETITSKSLRGKVVLVNFWATTCKVCLREMPKMVDTYNRFKEKGLEFVAVAMSYDAPNYVLNYTQSSQLPFTVALDGHGELAKAFGHVEGTPTTFVIDKNGKIIHRFSGEPGFAELNRLLEKELKV